MREDSGKRPNKKLSLGNFSVEALVSTQNFWLCIGANASKWDGPPGVGAIEIPERFWTTHVRSCVTGDCASLAGHAEVSSEK